jgi:hypothetical protein
VENYALEMNNMLKPAQGKVVYVLPFVLCSIVLLPGSVILFVYDFHQGVEGDPHFALVDDLSLT